MKVGKTSDGGKGNNSMEQKWDQTWTDKLKNKMVWDVEICVE